MLVCVRARSTCTVTIIAPSKTQNQHYVVAKTKVSRRHPINASMAPGISLLPHLDKFACDLSPGETITNKIYIVFVQLIIPADLSFAIFGQFKLLISMLTFSSNFFLLTSNARGKKYAAALNPTF